MPVERDSYIAPVAWWKLDEANGPTLTDSARGLYPLTLNGNAPTAMVGVADVPAVMPSGSKSIKFNAASGSLSGEYATRAYAAPLCGDTFSVSAWVKPYERPPGLWECILGPMLSGASIKGWFLRWRLSGSLSVFDASYGSSDEWQAVSSSVHTTGAWYHVVFQIEDNGASDKYRLYVNGELEDQDLAGLNYSPDTSAGFVIGGRSDYTKWNGWVDDVQYYDYILTTNDIMYLMINPGKIIRPLQGTMVFIR